MERHFTIHVHAHNDHGVLQRILLAFSRRRLRVRALQFFDLHDGKAADMQFDLDCPPQHARDVVAQLGAIVEVVQVWSEERSLEARDPATARLVAA
jgi:acetolactate synthase small subunit